MKKRRFFKIICCFCLLLCSTFFLTACTGGGSGGSGSSSGYDSDNPPKPDPGKQPPSSGDDSDIDIDDDGNIGGNGQVAKFEDYFSGYTVLTDGDGEYVVQDAAKTKILGQDKYPTTKFNVLLDRQIDVLAQDILYRLNYVYGEIESTEKNNIYQLNREADNYNENNPYVASTEYMISEKETAVVDYKTLLLDDLNNEQHDDSHSNTTVYANCLSCYQNSFSSASNSRINAINTIMLQGALKGKYTSLSNEGVNELVDTEIENNRWKYYNKFSSLDTSTEAKNEFKMAIAQCLVGNNAVGNYEFNTYKNLLNTINNLGYFDSQIVYKNGNVEVNKLVEYINNYIIGNDLITFDKDVFNCTYFKQNNYLINARFIMNAPYNDSELFSQEDIKYSPRLYKAYDLIVPAIVNQALNNTFTNTNKSIYPTFARVNLGKGTFDTYTIKKNDTEVQEMTTTGPLKLNSIILKPVKGSKPVALQLQIAVARDLKTGENSKDINDLACYAHDVVVELEVSIVYYKDGTIFNKVFTPDGEESSTVTIDSKGYVPTYIDTSDPNFDPTKVTFDPNNPNAKDPYSESFRKPYDTNGEILPFNFLYSIYTDMDSNTPAFDQYNGSDSAPEDMNTFTNAFKQSKDENGNSTGLYYDAGDNYIQFNFNIKSVKQYTGDNNSQLVDYTGNDIVYDISLMPFTF